MIGQYRFKGDKLIVHTLNLDSVVKSLCELTRLRPITEVRKLLKQTIYGVQPKKLEGVPFLVFGGKLNLIDDSNVELVHYTGYVLLEFNNLESEARAVSLRCEAAQMPQTLLAFVGCSGRSVKVVVSLTLRDGTLPSEVKEIECFHAEAYMRAIKYYEPQLNHPVSLKEPAPILACRMSYDAGVYYNPEAVAIQMDQPTQMPAFSFKQTPEAVPTDPVERLMPGISRTGRLAVLYNMALVNTTQKSVFYRAETGKLQLKSFLTSLAENCYQAGIPEEEALGWTFLLHDLAPHVLEARTTFRAIYQLKHALQRPTFDQLPKSTSFVLSIEAFMTRRYFFRHNEMSNTIEYAPRLSMYGDFKPYDSKAAHTMCIEAQREGIAVWDKDIDRFVCSDYVPTYHPITDFLNDLPPWDGVDHIRELAQRIPTDSTAWHDRFFRWFLSMVAHWQQLDTQHANSATPLLVGNQGCGKSTFCLNLLPPALRTYYTDSLDFGRRREVELALHRYALINLDEFDSIKSSQQSYVKQVLQKVNVSTRLPYQSTTQLLRRYATFIATSNNFDLLTDPTGSRRYICIEITGKISYDQPINYEQLYSQAVTLLAQNERYWFTQEEEAAITEDNQSFQQFPAEELLFQQYFTISEAAEAKQWLLATEILTILAKKQKGFALSKKVIVNFGRILKRHRVPSKRSSRGTVYAVEGR
jgi:hypothetical protein